MGRLKLFNDGNDDHDNDDISRIEVDKEYARRYQHNKEREDLHRFQELSKKGQIQESSSDPSSSDDDEEYDDINNPKSWTEFMDNLLKVKHRLYPEVIYKSDDESDGGKAGEENPKNNEKKPMYAKDVIAQHLLEEGPEFGETETHEKSRMEKSYREEQEELRREFLDAVKNAEEEGSEDEGDFLRVKDNKLNVNDEDSGDEDFKKKLGEYFGGEGELDADKMFLKDFFMKKMWVDKSAKGGKSVVEEDELDEVLRDEEELDKQEEYEGSYNFRFEEQAGDRVMGHSRKVEGSVRKKENARKEQRKNKEERMKIAEQERKDELKHLKNLKKKEMKKRMEKVMEVAGLMGDSDCPIDLDGLEDDFDPEEYDEMMKKVFDDKYYEMEDVDPDFGNDSDEDGEFEKPDFDKEDELLGLPKGWDVLGSGDGFLAARERNLKLKKVYEDDDAGDGEERSDSEEEEKDNAGDGEEMSDSEEEEKDNAGDGEEMSDSEEEKDNAGDGEERSEERKRKRKRKMSLVKKAKEEMMEEYYKLDYEDTIGDLKTRFKYAKVQPNRYGLKTEEILMMDDKELNQYVSVKKLTPYREKEWKVPNSKRYQIKMKAREVLRGMSKDQKTHKRRKLSKGDNATAVLGSDQNGKSEAQSNAEVGNQSRKAMRRQRKAELKLSHSRRVAYGEIQSSAKSK
ncbi:hypothetical protein Tsubulata_035854 [Turnera subulata]|uniref:Kri1-like C-terminal domain-containing protein n=1 Tax=Turnera subulata TaxID=218843 RepID=A0A9Q0FII0_9ROSI|nr:hypothetical protein Tsubulata_035854 [Turnera subulata]